MPQLSYSMEIGLISGNVYSSLMSMAGGDPLA
jgi:hypothetical protein